MVLQGSWSHLHNTDRQHNTSFHPRQADQPLASPSCSDIPMSSAGAGAPPAVASVPSCHCLSCRASAFFSGTAGWSQYWGKNEINTEFAPLKNCDFTCAFFHTIKGKQSTLFLEEHLFLTAVLNVAGLQCQSNLSAAYNDAHRKNLIFIYLNWVKF